MIGAVITEVKGDVGSEKLQLLAEDGRQFVFFHSQSCCETVEVADIVGDPSDLLNAPILSAESVSSDAAPDLSHEHESYTWTFYKFQTTKGAVTVRWLGYSNGYYSEEVEYKVVPAPEEWE